MMGTTTAESNTEVTEPLTQERPLVVPEAAPAQCPTEKHDAPQGVAAAPRTVPLPTPVSVVVLSAHQGASPKRRVRRSGGSRSVSCASDKLDTNVLVEQPQIAVTASQPLEKVPLPVEVPEIVSHHPTPVTTCVIVSGAAPTVVMRHNTAKRSASEVAEPKHGQFVGEGEDEIVTLHAKTVDPMQLLLAEVDHPPQSSYLPDKRAPTLPYSSISEIDNLLRQRALVFSNLPPTSGGPPLPKSAPPSAIRPTSACVVPTSALPRVGTLAANEGTVTPTDRVTADDTTTQLRARDQDSDSNALWAAPQQSRSVRIHTDIPRPLPHFSAPTESWKMRGVAVVARGSRPQSAASQPPSRDVTLFNLHARQYEKRVSAHDRSVH